MGSNCWREFDHWSPRESTYQAWCLDSAAGANGIAGDGTLSRSAPSGEGRDLFVHDPKHPVATLAGVSFHHFDHNLGPRDQASVEQRADVLVYTSPPLDTDVEIVGPLKAVIYASSEGASADFTAKLVDVWPEGYARIIEDGIKRGPDDLNSGARGAM
jgi:putative CocE/NonD family hydrolase